MKKCSKCHEKKPLNAFYKNAKSADGHQRMCKECMKDAYRLCRKKKYKHYYSVQKAREKRNQQRYMFWKQTQSCLHCGMNNSVCLDLHHRDPNKKDISIADAMYNWSWERLEKEIKKCDVLCANCHRIEHNRLRK